MTLKLMPNRIDSLEEAGFQQRSGAAFGRTRC